MGDAKIIDVKIDLQLDPVDVELLISALKTAMTTRTFGRAIGDKLIPKLMPKLAPPTPKADAREERLLAYLVDKMTK